MRNAQKVHGKDHPSRISFGFEYAKPAVGGINSSPHVYVVFGGRLFSFSMIWAATYGAAVSLSFASFRFIL